MGWLRSKKLVVTWLQRGDHDLGGVGLLFLRVTHFYFLLLYKFGGNQPEVLITVGMRQVLFARMHGMRPEH